MEPPRFLFIVAAVQAGSDKWRFRNVIGWSSRSWPKPQSMLFYDINNGISRRAWARNYEALFAIKREMERTPNLKVPEMVDMDLLEF